MLQAHPFFCVSIHWWAWTRDQLWTAYCRLYVCVTLFLLCFWIHYSMAWLKPSQQKLEIRQHRAVMGNPVAVKASSGRVVFGLDFAGFQKCITGPAARFPQPHGVYRCPKAQPLAGTFPYPAKKNQINIVLHKNLTAIMVSEKFLAPRLSTSRTYVCAHAATANWTKQIYINKKNNKKIQCNAVPLSGICASALKTPNMLIICF